MTSLTCIGCKAKCCRYVTVEIKEPKNKEDYEEILWYFLHQGIEIFIEDGIWNILFNSNCIGLDKESKCKFYNKRPKVCMDHSINECEEFGKSVTDNYYFKNYKEFLGYLKNKGIECRDIDSS